MGGAAALQHYLISSDERLVHKRTGLQQRWEQGRRLMPQTGASFRVYRRFWRSFCEDLTMRLEKSSADARVGSMHVVMLGGIRSSPSRKTQTGSASTYGREPVYLQCHHLGPS